MAKGLVPDLPQLRAGDTLHGQGLLPRAGTAQQTPALCVPGLGAGQLCHRRWGPGRREQAVGTKHLQIAKVDTRLRGKASFTNIKLLKVKTSRC